jgi:hypothetical protein
MFIAVLFTIAKLWINQDAPLLTNRLRKCGTYTMEFYSATKKNEISTFAGKWMELENIILSKVIQPQKTKNCMFSFICGL